MYIVGLLTICGLFIVIFCYIYFEYVKKRQTPQGRMYRLDSLRSSTASRLTNLGDIADPETKKGEKYIENKINMDDYKTNDVFIGD